MDKWMDNPWFIKIIALLLAVLLYSSVPHTGKNSITNVPGEQSTATIENVPVKVYYDTENLVVEGIPNTVDVKIEGPITHVQTAKALRNFEVFIDLTDAKVGMQKVTLQIEDLSDKLKATINPKSVTITVQEKITKEFNVEAEFNSDLIEEGFSAGQPVVEPKKVSITGAKSEIEQITYVKAVLEEKDKLKETVTKEAAVQVLDKDLNKLKVEVKPETVKVKIPIKENSKTVPIKIVEKGSPPSGVTIESITLDTKEAKITGDEEVLKNTESVRVEVDISKITDNTTIELPVIISNDIIKVSPQMVKVTIEVSKQEEKTVSGIPITIRGLGQNLTAEITEPSGATIDLVLNGSSDALKEIETGSFNAYVDLANLEEGSHEVQINVEGPTNINWKAEQSTATITITNNA